MTDHKPMTLEEARAKFPVESKVKDKWGEVFTTMNIVNRRIPYTTECKPAVIVSRMGEYRWADEAELVSLPEPAAPEPPKPAPITRVKLSCCRTAYAVEGGVVIEHDHIVWQSGLGHTAPPQFLAGWSLVESSERGIWVVVPREAAPTGTNPAEQRSALASEPQVNANVAMPYREINPHRIQVADEPQRPMFDRQHFTLSVDPAQGNSKGGWTLARMEEGNAMTIVAAGDGEFPGVKDSLTVSERARIDAELGVSLDVARSCVAYARHKRARSNIARKALAGEFQGKEQS